MDKYQQIKSIGQGAFGTVHLTIRNRDKKLLILKEIPMGQMSSEERASAQNEVQILKVLHHPNIIQYYENFFDGNKLVIAMEYAPGGTLFDYLQAQNGPLREEKVLNFFIQIVVALHHIHSKNILHRDLKTQNILLDKSYRVIKVSDFGISKVLDTKTKAVTVVGTPCYISPEICNGFPYNQKSDIWALGCMVYELMTLKRAFEAQNLPALIIKIVKGEFDKELPKHYSKKLTQMLLLMLDLEPVKRPNVDDILAEPFVVCALVDLYLNIGAVEVKNAKTTSLLPGGVRTRAGPGNLHLTTSTMSVDAFQISKNPKHFCIYYWGGGITTPVKLSLPNSTTQVEQAVIGRTRKACVTKSGKLITWETTSSTALPGALGDSQNIPSFSPRYMEGQSGVSIKQVVCGDLHMACLTDRGILMTLGSGSNGCLGHGKFQDLEKPTIVESFLGYEISQIASGSFHLLAITKDGEVFSWGRGDNGRLGLGDGETRCVPTLVTLPDQVDPLSVHCGNDCSMILTKTKMLLACGNNVYNRLGLDVVHNRKLMKEVDESRCFVPVRSQPMTEGNVTSLSVGMQHSAIVTEQGQLYTCGNNNSGQLGVLPSDPQPQPRVPHLVSIDEKFDRVSCGATFTVAATIDAKIYSWGKASRGQLGRSCSSSKSISEPLEVVLHNPPKDKAVVSLCASHNNTLVVVSGSEPCPEKFRNSWDTSTWRDEGKKPSPR